MYLQPIFEICAKETGYKGGRKLREPWWRQVGAQKQLEATLKKILAAAGGAAAIGIRQAWRERWRRGGVGLGKRWVREGREMDFQYAGMETGEARVGG